MNDTNEMGSSLGSEDIHIMTDEYSESPNVSLELNENLQQTYMLHLPKIKKNSLENTHVNY